MLGSQRRVVEAAGGGTRWWTWVPALADTVSKRLHGESVSASVPRGTLCQGGDLCGFCLVPAIFFSAVPSPFHIAILALAVCCFSRRPGRRVVVHLVRNFEMSEGIAAR